MTSLDTQMVHSGRQGLRKLGVHAPPIDRSTTYPLTSLSEARDSIDQMMEGRAPGANPVYARLHNPTIARFEDAIAELEGAESALGFASGMAAISACLLAASQSGGHVVAVRPLYGGTDALLSSGLLGLSVTWADPERVAAAITDDTALVMVETPANPTLKLVDIAAVADQCGGVPLLVDSTFATPVLQRPMEHGATMTLHSASKYIGGHGDALGGVVACDEAWARILRPLRSLTGGVLSPQVAYELHRGLQTLSVRVHRAQSSAQLLASRLVELSSVQEVRYPGFPICDPQSLVGRQMSGPGAMIAFELDGGLEQAAHVMERVELITPAVSLGSTDTLIQHPAGLTHRKVDSQVCAELGISDGLLRLSVGLEDAEDLWRELAEVIGR